MRVSHHKDRKRYFLDDRLEGLFQKAALVIFDMNGLIVDDEQLQLDAMNRALGPFGIRLNEEYWMKRCAGTKSEEFTGRILEENKIKFSGSTVRDLVRKKNEQYRVQIAKNIKALTRPGVAELVSHVHEDPYQTLALATTASEIEIEAIVGDTGLNIRRFFRYIASGSDVLRSKPDPEIYSYLSGISHTKPADCLVFEDSGPGLLAASRAGMLCIAVPNRFTAEQDLGGAAFVVSDLTSNARILKRGSPV
jgi:HAD superfamily hydrolase (TIGR01509 family)